MSLCVYMYVRNLNVVGCVYFFLGGGEGNAQAGEAKLFFRCAACMLPFPNFTRPSPKFYKPACMPEI